MWTRWHAASHLARELRNPRHADPQESLQIPHLSPNVSDVPKTPRQRIADLLLGRPVEDFIAERRANADSWTSIAIALRDATDGEIDVTGEAIRQWAVALCVSEKDAA